MTIESNSSSNDLVPRPLEAGTCIELFTGAGGLALAMRDAGFRHLLTVERDECACATLLGNTAEVFPLEDPGSAPVDGRWPLIQGDVRDIDFSRWRGEVDVVAGGVPCQPWSTAGQHKGCHDPRNLWPELLRCVRDTRPLAVIAENVRGLLRPSFAPYYSYILRQLALPCELPREDEEWADHDRRLLKALEGRAWDTTEHYDVTFRLLNAADYGVPQIRSRVFVVAFRGDLGLKGWTFPDPTHSEMALLESQSTGEYWRRHGIKPRRAVALSAPTLDIDQYQPWRTVRDAIREMPEPVLGYEPPGWPHHKGWPGGKEYPGHTPNVLDRPAKTIKAGVHGVPGGECVLRLDDGSIRNLTVREAARLMTFPDGWRLSGSRGEQMRQLGNAVPVALGRAVARSVADALRDAEIRGA